MAERIPESIIQEILAKNDIVSVVGQYVRFTKTSGSNLFGLCPFHTEDTPSFSVSKTKQICYCFGCHKGGDSIRFIMEIEKCSYVEALKILADKVGITLPDAEDDHYKQKFRDKEKVREALVEAARFYFHNLQAPHGTRARTYLQQRKISVTTAKRFGLGYAPDRWDGLLSHLLTKGFDKETLSHCGLFVIRDDEVKCDLFRDRLMFPIFDVMGKIVAFGGRLLSGEGPKYINSPESVVFSKQRNLYALNYAKNTKEKRMVVVEGYMDAISMHQAGFDFAVAPLGTALTESQLIMLARYTEEILFFFDADRAGQQAALRSLKMLMDKNKKRANAAVRISVAIVPNGKDPDEYIREFGAEAFRTVLNHAVSATQYLLHSAKVQAKKENGEMDLRIFKNFICEFLSWEGDAVLRETAAREAAEILGVSVESVLTEIAKVEKEYRSESRISEMREVERRENDVLQTAPENNTAEKDEVQILCMLSQITSKYKEIEFKPLPSEFSIGVLRDIATQALNMIEKGSLDPGSLMGLCEEKALNEQSATHLFAEEMMKRNQSGSGDSLVRQTELYILKRKKKIYQRMRAAYLHQCLQTTIKEEKDKWQKYCEKTDEYLRKIQERMTVLHGK